jgi:Mor family transcriptional regulator
MKKYKVLAELQTYGGAHSTFEGKTGEMDKTETILHIYQEFIFEVENELYDKFWISDHGAYKIIRKEIIKDNGEE